MPSKKPTENEEKHKKWLGILNYLLDPEVKDVEAEGAFLSGLHRVMGEDPSKAISILRHNARVALESSPTEWADLSPLFVEVERTLQLRRVETSNAEVVRCICTRLRHAALERSGTPSLTHIAPGIQWRQNGIVRRNTYSHHPN